MERIYISQVFHETLGKKIADVREVLAQSELQNLQEGSYFVKNIPVYVSQLSGSKKNKIDSFYGQINDSEAARHFGADNLEEFSYWAWRSCGVVGLQMIFESEDKETFKQTTMDLIKEGLDMEGYDTDKDKGWYHQSLLDLAKRHGFKGRLDKFIPPSKIASYILEDNYVLASIDSETGGHLLLLYGFKLGQDGKIEGFWHHDPNDFVESGNRKYIKIEKFSRLSTRRAVIIEKNG